MLHTSRLISQHKILCLRIFSYNSWQLACSIKTTKCSVCITQVIRIQATSLVPHCQTPLYTLIIWCQLPASNWHDWALPFTVWQYFGVCTFICLPSYFYVTNKLNHNALKGTPTQFPVSVMIIGTHPTSITPNSSVDTGKLQLTKIMSDHK